MTEPSPIEPGPVQPARVALDRRRYLRVAAFLARLFAHILWWDWLLRKLIPEGLPAATADRRWRRLSGEFRQLAIDLGGVLIKLGQFLSIRVDVLPPAVTEALAGLQDEVPEEPIAAVRQVIETAFGRPLGEVFVELEPRPLGAASLAQVHRARLSDGRRVVVKVQRPGIERKVETDLAALTLGIRGLKRFRFIRQRVDVDLLYAEFARITRAELDFEHEAANAERFRANFADDPALRVPRIEAPLSRRRVLTMEDVSAIRIGDLAALDAAGIDRGALATKLTEVSMRQVFEHALVHADPHPGNLFVHALPRPAGARPEAPRPFAIAFVDFGMMAEVPERLRANLRDYAIGFATRDAERIVRAAYEAGFILPGADLKRIEQAQAAILKRFWGVRMGQLQDVALQQARQLGEEYRDLLQSMPFQFPADMLFVGRALGMLSGMATRLDPGFNAWSAIVPYAMRLAGDGAGAGHRPAFDRATLNELLAWLRPLLTLPRETERFLGEVAAGELRVRVSPAADAREAQRETLRALRWLRQAVIHAAFLVAGSVLWSAGPGWLPAGLMAFGGAGLLLGLLRR